MACALGPSSLHSRVCDCLKIVKNPKCLSSTISVNSSPSRPVQMAPQKIINAIHRPRSASGSSVWLDLSDLGGPGFSNGLSVGMIVVNGVIWMALLAISFWALRSERRSNDSNSVMGWKKFGIAIILNWIYYACSFAQVIIQTNETAVANIYFLIVDILGDILYPATTALLFTIYSLPFYYCITPPDAKHTRHRGFLNVHVGICTFMIALYIAILALDITNTSNSVQGNETYTYYRVASDLNLTFQAILLAASIEILAFAIWLSTRARRHGQHYVTASLYFLVLVALPFFIQRIVFFAYAAALLLSYASETLGAQLAFIVSTGVCTIISFIGIALASKSLQHVRPPRWDGDPTLHPPPTAYTTTHPAQPYSQYSYGPVNLVPAVQTPAVQITAVQSYSHELYGQGQGPQEMPTYLARYEKP